MDKVDSLCLSIIIVSYNTREVTRNCISSIYQNHPKQPFEVIVIDNNSSDGTPEAIEREFPGVILIKNTTNSGFAPANNQGIEISKGKYVLLLNSDTLTFQNSLDGMMTFMDAHSNVGAVTPRIWLDEGKTLQSHILHPFTVRRFLYEFTPLGEIFPGNTVYKSMWSKDIRAWLADAPLEVDCFSGACMMVRREALNEVGPLDERFFMFFEDVDFCMRLKEAGWKFFLVPDAEIVHLAHQSPSNRLQEIYMDSLAHFLEKHYPFYVRWFLNASFLFGKVLGKVISNLPIRKACEDGHVSNILSWSRDPAATGYILEIAVDPSFINKAGNFLRETCYEIPREILSRWPKGSYFWRVAPLMNNGTEGEFSTPKVFRKQG